MEDLKCEYVNNYIKCKYNKHTNIKAQIIRFIKSAKPKCMLQFIINVDTKVLKKL